MEAEEASIPPPAETRLDSPSWGSGSASVAQASCNLKTRPRPVFQTQFLRPLLGRPDSGLEGSLGLCVLTGANVRSGKS